MHKEIRNTLAWLIFAAFVTGTAVWQGQIAAASDLAAKRRALPPPRKTKRAIRPAPVPFTGDVVQDYIARCEKGMTDQEILWVIEDFHNTGLDLKGLNDNSPFEQLLAYRIREHRWYHDALVDGLRLDAAQSAQVTAKLAELLETAKNEYKGTTDPSLDPPTADPLRSMIGHSLKPYQPWNLCALTSAQQDLTWKKWTDDPKSSGPPPSPPQLRFQNSRPFGVGDTSGEVPRDFLWADSVLPILALQKLVASEDPFAEFYQLIPNLRHLHPAQLKILLLANPGIADETQRQFDTESR